jgi:hypothetical protein
LETISPGATPVIVLVLQDEKKDLRFLVHPELRSIVRKEDSNYTESLLTDFTEREVDSEALFKQLSSLSVGPLVTHEVGSMLSDYPDSFRLSGQFVNF